MKSSDSNKDSKQSKKSKPYDDWTQEAYDNFRNYQIKYYKEKYRTFAVKYSKEKDADVIDFLESQENIANWIREKAREDIAKLSKTKKLSKK